MSAELDLLERPRIEERRAVAPRALPAPPRSKRVLFLLRRLHLYSGLLLLPWVLLYGVSAFLFNHPGAFAERSLEHVSAATLERAGMRELLDPERIARAVVDSANASAADGAKLSLPQDAHYELTGRLSFERTDGVARSSLGVDLGSGTARIVTDPYRAREAAPRQPGWASEIKLDRPPSEDLRDVAGSLLDAAGAPAGQVAMKAGPKLAFDVLRGAEPVRVSYDLFTNKLAVRATDGAERSSSMREIFTQLHTAHGYEARVGARSLWAVAVDGMALAMVAWAVTGVVMWWQIKRTRSVGALMLALSFAAAIAVAWALHP